MIRPYQYVQTLVLLVMEAIEPYFIHLATWMNEYFFSLYGQTLEISSNLTELFMGAI